MARPQCDTPLVIIYWQGFIIKGVLIAGNGGPV